MDMQLIPATERKRIKFGYKHAALKEWLHKEWPDSEAYSKNKKVLGLHPQGRELYPGDFIGAVWIGEGANKAPLIVRSKFPKMDYMSMYLECVEHPKIKNNLNKCFDFWPDESPIATKISQELDELLIAIFLRELNELCLRHLRKHFEKETANLTGKVKGKILIHQQVKRNLVHGRSDKVFCSYQTIKQDIPENRILRAALEQSSKFINTRTQVKRYQGLHRWIHSCRAALSGVPSIEVKESDFRNLRMRGAFSHYRLPIELAKFVLMRKGTNPRAKSQDNTSTPPFAINSAELFERYAEKILRQKEEYPELKSGRKIHGNNKNFKVCPDFWVPRDSEKCTTATILDAKYKKVQNDISEIAENDAYQMVAYSRHKNLLGELNCKEDDDQVELILVYPELDSERGVREGKADRSFGVPLSMHFIKCPTIS